MKILHKTLLKSLIKATLLFCCITLFCTLLFDFALKSNLEDTSIKYFFSLALVRVEHILPFSVVLSITSLIYSLKHNKLLNLLQSMSLNKYKIYSIFWLYTLSHLFLLLLHYQVGYPKAKNYIEFQRFNNTSNSQNLKLIQIDSQTKLIYSDKKQDTISNAYLIHSDGSGYFCPKLHVQSKKSIGLHVIRFQPASDNLISHPKRHTFNNIHTDLFNNQQINNILKQDIPILKTLNILMQNQKPDYFENTTMQKSLMQKIILVLCPLLLLPLILHYINNTKTSLVSSYFFTCSLFFTTLLFSKIYTLLLSNYLIHSLSPFFSLLLAIAIYSLKINHYSKKLNQKKYHESNKRMLRKTH